MLGEFESLDNPSGKGTAFEDLALGLIIVLIPHIDGKELLKIDDLKIFSIDLDGHGPPIDRFHCKSPDGRGDQND
jgi:hypothetical protein